MKPLNALSLFAGAWLLPFQGALGDTLALSTSAIAPSIQHLGGPVGGLFQDNQFFTFPSPAVHLRDYNTIQVSIQAPPGKAWFVDTDSAFSFQTMAFKLDYNNGFAAPFAAINSASLEFNFAQGGVANFTSTNDGDFIPTTGDRFALSRFLRLNGDIAFTGFTMTVQFDNSSLADSPLSIFNQAELYFQYQLPPPGDGGSVTEPGTRLALAPIPEPSVAALSLSCGLALIAGLAHSRKS